MAFRARCAGLADNSEGGLEARRAYRVAPKVCRRGE